MPNPPIARQLPYQVPALNLTPAMAANPELLLNALQSFGNDLTTYLQRISATLNLNNRGNFAPSGSGYFSIFGFYVQWGTTTASSTGVVTNFPIPFPNALGAVLVALDSNAPASEVGAVPTSKTQFTAYSSVAGPVNVSYIAIGN